MVTQAGGQVLTIYLPDATEELKALADKFVENATQRFGGCTEVEGRGHWVAPRGVVVSERVRTVTVVVEVANNINRQAFHAMAKQYLKDSGEESVLYTVSGKDVIYINKEQ